MGREKSLIKSTERVKKFGEVFTPEWVVRKMCDELPPEAFEIGKTVLEPSCGTGNFLVEVFRRKLENCRNASEGLRALASIYGVDILADNVVESRNRLLNMYREKFPDKDGFTAAALNIITRNIICADFLKIADRIKAADNWEKVIGGNRNEDPQSKML